MCVMDFHLLSSATPGVGAGTHVPRAVLNRTLAVRVVDEILRRRAPFSRSHISDGLGVDSRRGTRRSVTLVNVAQEAFQTCNPCSGSRVTLALFWREGEKHLGSAQGLPLPPAALCGLTQLTKDLRSS